MTDKDLKNQLEGLFADTVLEPEAGAKETELLLEEAITGLLGGEAEAEPAAASPTAGEFRPPVLAKPEETLEEAREEHSLPQSPPASARFWKVTPGEQHTRMLSILLRGVTILGGVLLVFLLIRLIWPILGNPMVWSGFHTLYFAAYMVAIVITLIQWMFNSSLIRALREAEDKRAEADLSQVLLKEQADELATANALLHKRTLQLQTAALISHTVASVLDPDELVQQAADLIRERLNLHYVGLFLIDEAGADDSGPDTAGQWAALRAGTGEAGRRMLAQGYKLEMGNASTVGQCMASAQACIAPDLSTIRSKDPTESSTERPGGSVIEINSLLPESRSEMALPLRSGDRVIGVLDVHSAEREAFSQEDIAVLQAVADQMAVAIDNAQLFVEIQARLEEMGTRQRHHVREQWADFASSQAVPSYERIQTGVTHLDDVAVSGGTGELGQAIKRAMAQREVVVQPSTGSETGQATLVVPISLRDEVLGVLGLHDTEGRRWWTDDEIALVEAVADQMALAIENARLLGEAQERAEHERVIADITARVRSSMDPETILRTAVRELGAALGTDRAFVRLGIGGQSSEE
jgi:GAF domain-containing protein